MLYKGTVYVLLIAFTLILRTVVVYASDNKIKFDAHATEFKYFFSESDMDFHFGNLVLGSIVNKGTETGEAFYAASQIKDGDAESWQQQWYELAQRIEKRANISFKSGDIVSARDLLQRAAYYYRFSLLAILPTNPELKKRALKSRDLLKKAGKLFTPQLQYIEIPFKDTVLTGYIRKARNDNTPTKTLIMIGGGETFAEDLFFYLAPQAFDRGYNFICIDLPGQGLLPLEGYTFIADMYIPMKTVVDYVVSRKDVDNERIAAYGISGGGGFVPQAAMHDQRIKAIAMNSAVVDAYPLFKAMPVTSSSDDEKLSWSTFHANIVKVINWRWGVPMDDPEALIEANKGFKFDPSKVKQPALIIIGEGEYNSEETRKQQEYAMKYFPNAKKKIVITPSNEGASNHCVMENRSLVGVVLFDWLDEIFK